MTLKIASNVDGAFGPIRVPYSHFVLFIVHQVCLSPSDNNISPVLHNRAWRPCQNFVGHPEDNL